MAATEGTALHEGNCLILKDGPAGVVIAARLTVLGCNPHYVGRKDDFGRVAGISAWGQSLAIEIQPFTIVHPKTVSIVFVTVKAYDLAGILRRFLNFLPKDVIIVVVTSGYLENTLGPLQRKHRGIHWRLGVSTLQAQHLSGGWHVMPDRVGKLIWGPLPFAGVDSDSITPVEKKLLEKDGGTLFQFNSHMKHLYHQKWLFDVVIDSVCAAWKCAKIGDLLNNISEIKEILREAMHLGEELWGEWPQKYDKLLEELLTHIAKFSAQTSPMLKDLQEGRRLELKFLAGLARKRRGYDWLKGLTNEITEQYSQAKANAKRGGGRK